MVSLHINFALFSKLKNGVFCPRSELRQNSPAYEAATRATWVKLESSARQTFVFHTNAPYLTNHDKILYES